MPTLAAVFRPIDSIENPTAASTADNVAPRSTTPAAGVNHPGGGVQTPPTQNRMSGSLRAAGTNASPSTAWTTTVTTKANSTTAAALATSRRMRRGSHVSVVVI